MPLPLFPQTVGHAIDLLAALPFLPAGRGALILIFGGLAVLPVSLLLSRASALALRWVAGLEQGVQERGLGPCRIVVADARSCVVRLAGCMTCRTRPGQGGPCESEARGLRLAASRRAPGAKVVEIACNPRLGCTFVIHRGRSS